MGNFGSIDGYSVDDWWLLFNGAFQKPTYVSGLQKLKVIAGKLASPTVQIETYSWKDDYREAIDSVLLWESTYGAARLNIAGFSLGGGTAVYAAQYCRSKGRAVNRLVLLDPKHWLCKPLVFLSYHDIGVLEPPRPGKAWHFFQKGVKPRGTKVVWPKGFTPEVEKELSCKHAELDDEPEVRDILLKEICDERR